MLECHDCEKNISEQEIREVENKLGVFFPADFKAHYLKWNGGTPNKPIFENPNIDYDYIEIRDFIAVKYARDFGDDPDFTLEGRAVNEWEKMELPPDLIPYAFDWGGNYICLHKNSGRIYYYVRDVWSDNISTEANFAKNTILIADSFTEFLSYLCTDSESAQERLPENILIDSGVGTNMLEFHDCEKNISEQEIREVENKLEVSFPADFKAHYLKWNGGTPNKPIFENPNIDYDYIEIRDFIAVKYARDFGNDPDFTLEGRAVNGWEKMELPPDLIPYAFDWGGSYICLHKNSGRIYYYVRDVWSDNISTEANFAKNTNLIADSFTEFLSYLHTDPEE